MPLKGIYLTLLVGPVVPVPVPQFVLDALTNVEITSRAGGRSGFRLTFTIDNHSPLQTVLLLSGGALPPVVRVILVVTLNGTPNVLADGVITRQSIAPASQPGLSNLTIYGEDLSVVMDRIEFTGFPYPAMPLPARVLVILAKYAAFGMIPLVIPPLFLDVPVPVERYPSHQGTDLHYLNQMAEEAGYTFYIEPGPVPGTNTAYWGPEIKLGVPQPALNVDMDIFTNVESLSFNFDKVESTLPIVFIQNALTKAPIPIPIPSVSILNPPLGVIPPPPTTVKMLHYTAQLSPMQAILAGLREASQSADAVTGSGTLNVVRYGRLLRARQLVGVRGAGMAFDGLYYIKSVTTTLQRGELKQSFELTRNGLISITPKVPV